MASAAPAASSDEFVISDEKACLDLYKAARDGKLDEVTRLLPLATEKGVVNKVCTRSSHRDYRGRGEA